MTITRAIPAASVYDRGVGLGSRTFAAGGTPRLNTSRTLVHGIGTGEFTFGAWVSRASTGTYDTIWCNGDNNPDFYITTGNVLAVYWAGDANSGFGVSIGADGWHYCVIRRKGTTLTGWVDGRNGPTTPSSTASCPTAIQRFGNYVFGDYMDGKIAQAALWDVALTEAEIRHLSRGAHPRSVRAGNCKMHFRLPAGTRDARDSVSGLIATPTGTVGSSGDEPAILRDRYPAIPVFIPSAAPAAGHPRAMRHHMHLLSS